MKGFDILHLRSAVQSRNHFDLSFPHLTTMAIGQIQPVLHKPVIPADEWHVNGKVFSRVAPLEVPTYGRLDLKTASFYVPYHQVAEDADAWFTGKKSYSGQTPRLRYCLVDDIVEVFHPDYQEQRVGYPSMVDEVYRFDSWPTEIGFRYDMVAREGDACIFWTFSTYGRWAYKFLTGLGYQLPSGYGAPDSRLGVKKINLLPFLCAAKAYNDWMSNSSKYDLSELSSILLNIRQNKPFPGYESSGLLTSLAIVKILYAIRLVYESDYFTTAWLNPNNVAYTSQNSVDELQYKASSIGNGADKYARSRDEGTYINAGGSVEGVSLDSVSQRGLDFLRAFDNWVKRNNYAGSRDVQQIYARFGIKPDYYRTHFAEVLGTSVASMNVGDVMATANTYEVNAETTLGEYAGKGIISGDVVFDCKCSDYGEIITLAWVAVHASNPFGFDREVLRSEPLDFFTPEFDGLSGDAISVAEVYADPRANTTRDGSETFGFTERYNDYRCSREQITGDFRIYDTMKAWHFGRDLTQMLEETGLQAQSDAFMYYSRENNQYNRIFNIVDGGVDPFYTTFYFDIDAVRPMKNFNEVPNLGVGNTNVPKNGNVIN